MDKLLGKRAKASLKPSQIVGRFLVIKQSWRGSYRRILCITPSEVFTQDPQQSLRTTNSYSLGADADVDGLSLGPGPDDFSILARGDKATKKFSPLRFSCKQRSALLTTLYQCIAGSTAIVNASLAFKLLGTPDRFPGSKWCGRTSTWQPVTIQLSSFELLCLDVTSEEVIWRVLYVQMGSPAVMSLANSSTVPPAADEAAEAAGLPVPGVFAVTRRGKRRPKVLACGSRDPLMTAVRTLAAKRLGCEIIVDDSTHDMSVQALLAGVAQADQQGAAELCESPMAEWEVSRLRPRHDVQPALAPLAAPHLQARPLSARDVQGTKPALELGLSGGANLVPRRLVLTSSHLVERRAGSYSLASCHPLSAISGLVRFAEDPQLLGVEWSDLTPPSLFLTPARDTILAAVLDAAQAANGCPIAVLPGLTSAGDGVVLASPTLTAAVPWGCEVAVDTAATRDVQRWATDELIGRARDTHPTLNTSGRMFFTADIDFRPTAALLHQAMDIMDQSTPSARAHPPPLSSVASDTSTVAGAANHEAATTLAEAPAFDSPFGPPPAAEPPPQQQQQQLPQLAGPAGAFSSSLQQGYSRASASGTGRGGPESATVREAVEVMMEAVAEFCACVPYSGVPSSVRLDNLAASALLALLPPDLQPGLIAPPHLPADEVKSAVLVFQALQRLVVSHAAAETLLATPGAIGRLFTALTCGEDHVAYEAARLLLRLTSPHTARLGAVPWRTLRGGLGALGMGDAQDPSLNSSNDDLELAKSAKAMSFTHSLLQTRVTQLLSPLKRERPPASPLLSLAVVEVVTSMACDPGSATTDTKLLHTLLADCAALGRALFSLFHHPALRVADGVAVLMRAIAESGTAAAAPMREASLREGAMLHHMLLASSTTLGPRTALSRDLVASWADEYAPALALMRRILPPGLIRHLNVPKNRGPAVVALPPPPPPPAPVKVTSPVAAPAGAGTTDGLPAAAVGQAEQQQQQQQATSATAVAAVATGGGDGAAAAAPATAGVAAAGQAQLSTSQPGGEAASSPQQPATPLAAAATMAAAAGAMATAAATGVLQPPAPPAPPPVPPAPVMHVAVGGGLRGNWDSLWEALGRDHCHAGLVWNESSRRELRDALQAEESELRARRRQVAFQAGAVQPTWNHEEFRVFYPSLTNKHTCIGGIYIRLLLEGADTAAVGKLPAPRDLFQSLHHHLICSDSHLMHAHTSSLHAATLPSQSAATANGRTIAALQSSALSEVESVQVLCVRAMTEVYHAHAGVVGAMEGLPHLLRLMDLSLRRPLRHHMLLLLAAALQPRAARSSPQAAKAARANAAMFCDEGGVELLVDCAAAAHEASDDQLSAISGPATGTQGAGVGMAPGLLLTAAGQAGGAKEWYYYPNGIIKATPAGKGSPAASNLPDAADNGTLDGSNETPQAPDATGRMGPVSKGELLALWREGKVFGHTLFWAEGLPAPSALASIRELRWLVSGGAPVLGSREVARLALQLLLVLARMQPATDSQGSVLQPLPRVLRSLAGPRCLPHITQVLLTRDPELVSQASAVLEAALAHNEDVLARLYRTGLFYFALSYAGSNLSEVAGLLAAAHLKQAHRGASSQPPAGAPLATRSYLGHLLPESLLYCLDTYGPQAFASALCGDSDTPELRWTHGMRWGRLIPQLTAHLGDLPARLAQNWSGVVWQYTPAPPVTYPELKDELWCHRYYLRALCNEVAFPDWTILDHVQLMQSLLAEWRAELSRQPLALSEADACAVLGLVVPQGSPVSEEDMRKAYRNMARKYHPDKNPAGRPMFLKVQMAYDRLQAGVAGGQGPQPWRIVLILKAQAILLRRFKALLAPYKYAGYPMLLEVLSSLHTPTTAPAATDTSATSTPGTTFFMSPEQVELTQAACELCWRTVCTSHLNADELARCGGVSIVAGLFQRLCSSSLLQGDNPPVSHAAIVATHMLRSIAGFAASEVAREQMANVPGLLQDIIRCCALTKAHAAAEAALVAVGHLCASPALQTQLLEADVLAHVVPLLFMYDATVQEDSSAPVLLPFTTHQLPAKPPALGTPAATAPAAPAAPALTPQAATAHSFCALELPLLRASEGKARNYRAMLAVQLLSRIAGVSAAPYQTPVCLPAQQAVAALLTHGLAVRLRDQDPRTLLALLNSGQETAQVIWNDSMREELLAVLSDIRAGTIAPTDTEAAGPGQPGSGLPPSLGKLVSWRYSALKDELQVGGVFIRVYCSNPSALPGDVPGFCKALVRQLYETFVTSATSAGGRPPSTLLYPGRARDLGETVAVLQALALLLDTETRLLGLLASKSAIAPLVAALQVAVAGAFTSAFPLSRSSSLSGSLPTVASPNAVNSVEATVEAAKPPAEKAGDASQQLLQLQPSLNRNASSNGGAAGSDGAAAQLAQAVLHVMSKLGSHAGCLEVLADAPTIRLLFYCVHCAPSAAALKQALGLLRAMTGQPTTGMVAAEQAGALLLLVVLLHPSDAPWPWPGGLLPGGVEGQEQVQGEAAALLTRLMASPAHGTSISMQLQRLLPPALVTTLASSPPSSVLSALRGRVSTPELVWDPTMASQAAAQLAVIAHQARMQQSKPGAGPAWALPASTTIHYHQLDGELRVGGVYCRLFLKDPQYPLKEPLRFGEGLAEALVAALSNPSATTQPGALPPSELVLLLSASAVALTKHHALVADTLASQGCIPRLLSLLAARLPTPAPSAPDSNPPARQAQSVVDEGGALLRLLHALAASATAAEAMAAAAGPPGAVAVLAGARAWGYPAEVLVLETLKRILGDANRSRDTLVGQAVQAGLVPSLLSRLDWQQAAADKQQGDADVAVLRALSVDVLMQLSAEGTYGEEVSALLDASPIWAAYRGQRHDLFLPSGAAAEGSVAGLLTGAGATQFALPAPERLNSNHNA